MNDAVIAGEQAQDIDETQSNACFQLKGSVVTMTLLELYDYQHANFREEMSRVTQQAPNFFQQTPVVLSLKKLNENSDVDFIELTQLCQEYGLFPIAIRGGNQAQQMAALVAGLPRLPDSKPKIRNTAVAEPSETAHDASPVKEIIEETLQAPAGHRCKVIDRPVRSGQQIYARDSDLIVLGPVSPGAEILADGHIHVYAPVRGRILAGVNGNLEARIFCRRLEPELVSIAGHYKISDDIPKTCWGQPVQVWLQDKHMNIEVIA